VGRLRSGLTLAAVLVATRDWPKITDFIKDVGMSPTSLLV
jgi:hypothetical protein